jgi:hypothetical protein
MAKFEKETSRSLRSQIKKELNNALSRYASKERFASTTLQLRVTP